MAKENSLIPGDEKYLKQIPRPTQTFIEGDIVPNPLRQEISEIEAPRKIEVIDQDVLRKDHALMSIERQK